MTDPTTLLDLATRAEQASAEEQVRVILEAFEATTELLGEELMRAERRLCAMLRLGAWESAALLLVPAGWGKMVCDADNGLALCDAWKELDHEQEVSGLAKTWALAIVAASCRARAQDCSAPSTAGGKHD